MRSLSSLVLVASSAFLLACSLDTEQFAFDGAAGGSAAGTGGASPAGAGGAAGTSIAGSGGSTAGAGGSLGGTGGSTAGMAGAGGLAGTAGTSAGSAGSSGSDGGSAGTGGSGGIAGAAGNAGAAGAPAGECTLALDGFRRCNGKIVEQCTDGAWTELTVCTDGCNQKGVGATCTVCAPGSKACSGDKLQVCSADGTKYTDEGGQDCSIATLLCEPTLNACVACNPGTFRCVGTQAIPCTPLGTDDFANGKECGSAELCTPGTGCQTTAACAQGDFQCDGGQIRYCKDDFSDFKPAEACPSGTTCFEKVGCQQCQSPDGTSAQYCKDPQTLVKCEGGVETLLGTCAMNGCDPVVGCKECVPNTTFCSADGKSYFECGPDGKVGSQVTCPGGNTCDPTNGKCSVCQPGTFFCEDKVAQLCLPNGSGYQPTDCGATNQVCDKVSQQCVECVPGEQRCTGAILEKCSGSFVWDRVDTCASADFCDPGKEACIKPACDKGEIVCKEQSALVCKKDRTGFEDSVKCDVACLPNVGCGVATSVSVAGDQACAIVSTANVPVCWGFNTGSKAGAGTLFGGIAGPVLPRVVKGLSGIKKIESGNNFMCALDLSGTLLCWGDNPSGQLGTGGTLANGTPTAVPGLPSPVTDFSLATNGGVCAIAQEKLYCWGRNVVQPPTPAPEAFTPTPTVVPTTFTVERIAVGAQHRCLVDAKSNAYCWGKNGAGQLGIGTTLDAPAPSTRVGTVASKGGSLNPLENVRTIAVSSSQSGHSCATTDLGIFCWGNNLVGQVGNGSSATSFSAAVSVPNTSGWIDLTLGAAHSCASFKTTSYCWGSGRFGANGDPNLKEVSIPTPFNLEKASQLEAGPATSCAVVDGAVFCWGDNSNGQLGVPTTTLEFSATPVPISFP